MKKIALIVMMTAFIATSCSSSKKVESVAYAVQQENSSDSEKTTKYYDLKDFTGIKSETLVEIVYKQDNKYMVKVTGRRKDMERTDISVDKDNVLCFNRKKKTDNDEKTEKLFVELSCPNLESISNSGIMDMTAKSIEGGNVSMVNDGNGHFSITVIKSGKLSIRNGGIMELSSDNADAGKLHIGNSGRVSFNIGTLKSGYSDIGNSGIMGLSSKTVTTDKLDMNNSGRMDMSVDNIKTGDCMLDNNGVSDIKSVMIDCSSLDIKQSGRFNLKSDLKSDNVNIHNSGIIDMKSNITGGNMSISQSGRCTANIVFKGRVVNIGNTGIGDVDINLDCDELIVDNSGKANLNISGTAEKTSVKGSGITNTNTKELNKF